MSRKLVILSLLLLLAAPFKLLCQPRAAFSGDPSKFTSELTAFMGPNMKPEQSDNLKLFIARWDSASFSSENMMRIIDISSQLSSRLMRPVPHFNDFLLTINNFIGYRVAAEFFSNWLSGISEILFNPRYTNDNVDRYFRNTSSLIRENTLFDSGSVKWKVKNNAPKFLHDTIFCVAINNATLTCYSQRDSTEIYDVSGIYYPELQEFRGTKGLVTWEKAGYSRKDVYAEIRNYRISTLRNSFTIDSASLYHYVYFKKTVTGIISDQTITFTNKEKANFPRFETYTKHFLIKDLYEGVNYEGGISLEGASVKGTGEKNVPARITIYRHDTLSLKILSKEVLLNRSGLTSQETSATIYIGKDSIYHSNLGITYLAATRQVNLYRTNNPISRSPYSNSYHKFDMYFENLSWNLNKPSIILSRAKGSSMGQAEFESASFYNSGDFMRLMGLDDYHPLNRLVKFAEWFYSEKFPVVEFAKWLNRPEEVVTGMCIDLANKGFVYYDRLNNEIEIKQKTKDYLASFAKKKDYDIINIVSKTSGPVENAILNLKTLDLTVNGVSGILLSDSQKVAIHPYDQQLVIGKNRSMKFDGVVDAGLFTVYGKKFTFNYDTFKIRLERIDSIQISVETDSRDAYGNPIITDVNNLIQFGTAELYIDKPDNKSGLKSYKQYPIINSLTYSYIFYDRIPGLENVYDKKNFYFKVDPFTYENIDHSTREAINLGGIFFGGNITEPIRQNMTVQENNSLGFNMKIPANGISIYEKKGMLYDSLKMSNTGLTASGSLKYLTSETTSENYKLYPDSMLTHASTFTINKDAAGLYPAISNQDVEIKWLTRKDQYMATNAPGKSFNLFNNGTTLDGTLKLTPKSLDGTGVVNMTDSRITSKFFSFAPNAIKADTANYNLKSLTTGGYSFIAENANTDINFDLKMAHFYLNTDSSVVKFPEIQYICTMTDFAYNMETRILSMEQKGKSNTPLMTADKLIRLNMAKLDKPTFFATDNLSDTISFSSWKGSYHLDQEYVEADNINYIHVADALIQPDSGKIIINRRAKIKQMHNALIALNNKHILHSANIDIESTKRYSGSAVYDYKDENNAVQQIKFPELTVDTLTTSAIGFIPLTQNFKFSPAFTFAGDVMLSARKDLLTFTGSAGIIQNCNKLTSYTVKIKTTIDPKNVMIPISDKPRDKDDNLVFSGSFINTDSIHIYPAFLSAQKAWSDVAIVNANGFLYYDKAKERYVITSLEKIADPSRAGNMVSFDSRFCVLTGDGSINLGGKFDLVTLTSAGKYIHTIDSGKINLETILAFKFFFSQEALKMMADEIRLIPSLKPVNLNSELSTRGMKELVGVSDASQIKEDLDIFGTPKNLPKDFNYELVLNDVKLYWNDATSSFRSTGKIGIGFIGPQPINVYVDGFIEIQRRRSGDLFDIYLKADESTWYYFSYVRGVMMTQAGNLNYNSLIAKIKLNDRKHPESTVRTAYTYMIAVEDRLSRFLRRMAGDSGE